MTDIKLERDLRPIYFVGAASSGCGRHVFRRETDRVPTRLTSDATSDKSDYRRVYTRIPGDSVLREAARDRSRGQPRGLAGRNGENASGNVRRPIQTGRWRRRILRAVEHARLQIEFARDPVCRKNNGRHAGDHSSTKGRPICGSSSICFPPAPRPWKHPLSALPRAREWRAPPKRVRLAFYLFVLFSSPIESNPPLNYGYYSDVIYCNANNDVDPS